MEVNIVESPIASISVYETDLIENYNGYWTDNWNDETEKYEDFFYYYFNLKYTVTFNDGQKLSTENGYISYNGYEIYLDINQYGNHLKKGRNEVPFNLLGCEGTAVINVNDTPIKEIILGEINLIENDNGHWEYKWNEETGESEDYFYYYLPSLNYTVKLNDGPEQISNADGEIYYNGTYYNIDISQYNTPLKPGKNEVEFKILGYSGTVTINVNETPIKNVEFPEITLRENENGHWEYSDGNGTPETFFMYDLHLYDYTVTMQDGSVLYPDAWGNLEYNNSRYSVSVNQYNNHLLPGRNEVPFNLLGYNGTVVINVDSSPVESVVVDDLHIIENFNGYWFSRYNPDTDQYDRCFSYNLPAYKYSINFKNGVTVNSVNGTVYYDGGYYNMPDFSQYDKPLKPGTNEIEFTLGSFKGTFNIIVEESPVASVTVNPISIVENANGYFTDYASGYALAEEPGTLTEEEGTFSYEEASFYEEETSAPHTETTIVPTTAVPTTAVPTTDYPEYEETTAYVPTENYFRYYLNEEDFEYVVEFKDGTVQTSVDGTVTYKGNTY